MVKVWYSIIRRNNSIFSDIDYCYQDHLKIYEIYLKYYLNKHSGNHYYYIIKTYEHPLKFDLMQNINLIPTIIIFLDDQKLFHCYENKDEFEDFNLIEKAEQIITKRYLKVKEQYEKNKTKILNKFLFFKYYTFQTFADYLKNIGEFSYDMSTKKCKNILNLGQATDLTTLHETISLGPKKFYYLLTDESYDKIYKISQNEDEIMEALSLIRFNNKNETNVRLFKTYHHPKNMSRNCIRLSPSISLFFKDNQLKFWFRFNKEFKLSLLLKLRTMIQKLGSLWQLNQTTTEYEIIYDYAKEQEMINVIRS
jgi:hypothetical protein